jgi:GAF domain-containing protein
MLVHTTKTLRFNEDDATLLRLIANQTAIALERAQQYEASQRKRAYLESLYEVSKNITAQVGLEQKQILEQIVQPAMKGIVGIQGQKPVLGTIQLYDEESDKLTLASVFPPERFAEIERRLGERRPLHALLRKGEKIGVSGRVVLTGKPKLLREVQGDPDYIGCPAETRSELAVPLIDRHKVIGVLNVESDQPCAFDEEDVEALEALAELVAVALLNARRREELRTQTTLAWMGLGNAVGRHELARHVAILKARVLLLKGDLEKPGVSPESIQQSLLEIERKLQEFSVEGYIGRVYEEISSILVNEELIRACEKRIKASPSGRTLKLTTRCDLDEEARIRGNEKWLHRVLDIFINNSRDAQAENITLGSRPGRRWDSHVEIYVEDDGKGIPADVQGWLLRAPSPQREGFPGTGTGLLMAKGIAQIYEGSIYWEERKPHGTTMILSLPLEEDAGEESAREALPA